MVVDEYSSVRTVQTLLGEHGLVSHSALPTPELVYVPTIFIHPQIQSGFRPNAIGQIDIAPTALTALKDYQVKKQVDDVCLFDSFPGLRYHDAIHTVTIGQDERTIYHARGIRSGNRGCVFTQKGRLFSSVIGLKKARGWKREYWKTNPSQSSLALRCLAALKKEYGSPEFSQNKAKELIADIASSDGSSKLVEIDDNVERRLKELGYRPRLKL